MEEPHALFEFINSFFQRIRPREGSKTVKSLLVERLALCLRPQAQQGLSAVMPLPGSSSKERISCFPLGTLFVNIAGCFLAGLCYSILQEKAIFTAQVRIILLIGFFGTFSTFSSFMLETAEMTQSGQWELALANILLENILGFLFMVTGIMAGKLL